jgi:ABC-type antimicrobial peptide transport system permease subunit
MVLTGGIARVVLPGQEVRRDGDYTVSRRYLTSQFFSTLAIPLTKGRDLEDADADQRRNVAVISEAFVQRYWPNDDPIGKRFLFQDSLTTVVGVVRDIKVRGLERSSEPQMYLPSSRSPAGLLSAHDPKDLVIRASGSAPALLAAVREIVRRADGDQPISDVRPLADVLATQTAPRVAQLRVLVALAGIALLLAGLGINGLLAYTVSQQRQEIGVRLALGAEPGRIARRVVRDGLAIVSLGLIPGLLVALAAGRTMSALLFGVQPGDPVTLLLTVALCIAIAIAGTALPALRAVRVSPMTVMRAE